MTYNRPLKVDLPPKYDNAKNIYSRMAIYFDLHIYDNPEDRNDDVLYQYLYHIMYMLACKETLFDGPNSYQNYDGFALYAATKIYTRYINPKHQESGEKIVSVLNYCKTLLKPLRVDYLKEVFNEILGRQDGEDSFYGLQTSMEEAVKADYCDNEELVKEVLNVFNDLDVVIRKVVDRTPYKSDKILRHRLILSILLTLVNQTTLPTNINKREVELENKYILLRKMKNEDVILWRLPQAYYNLVHVLSAEVRKECSLQVGMARVDYELNDEDVTAVLMTAYGNVARDDNEEF